MSRLATADAPRAEVEAVDMEAATALITTREPKSETKVLAMKNVTASSGAVWSTNEESIARAIAQTDKKSKPTGKVSVTGLLYGNTTLTAVIDGQEYTCDIEVAAPVISKTEMTRISNGKQQTKQLPRLMQMARSLRFRRVMRSYIPKPEDI